MVPHIILRSVELFILVEYKLEAAKGLFCYYHKGEQTMKILIIAATHGNELLGIKLYQRLLRQRSPLLEYIDIMIGNPRAYHARKRYIDADLNRSYKQAGTEYEKLRSKDILAHIQHTKPDIVLDMHTTVCEQPNCLIVGPVMGPATKRMLKASHIPTILRVQSMNDIASAVNNAIGYEIPNKHITNELLDAIVADLERFVEGAAGQTVKQVYEMTGKIYKRDVTPEQAASFVNFHMHSLGFVPIMTGNNSYKKQTDYLGFKSNAPQEITL